MNFYIELEERPNKNKIILHNDNSFGQKLDNIGWNIQVALNSVPSFFLNFNEKEKKCLSCEGYIIRSKKTTFQEIKLQESYCGALKFICEECLDDCLVEYYLLKNDNVCYDQKNNRLGIGDFKTGKWFAVGEGQFAVFKGNMMVGFVVCFD